MLIFQKCDIKFEENDIEMSSYNFYLEKNFNLLQVQDFSRYQRTKFRIGKLPYMLDFDMVLELGGVKVAITKMFPNPQFPRRHHEVLYLETRDKKYPFGPLFEGELGRQYPEEELANIPYKLRDYLDLYIRKCDFNIPIDLEKTNVNPYVEMVVLSGPNEGAVWKMEKNLQYQMKVADKTGKIPEVKQEFYIGKGIKNDFETGVYTSKEYQATVYFDEMYGWCIRDEKYFWDIGPNYIFLANRHQLKQGIPSHLAKIQKGMIMCSGDYEFEWDVKNIRPPKVAEDIYDLDESLYLEEDDKTDIEKLKKAA